MQHILILASSPFKINISKCLYTEIPSVRFVLVAVKGWGRPPWHCTTTITSHPLWGVLLECGIAVWNVHITTIHARACGVCWMVGYGKSGTIMCWRAWQDAFCASYRWVFIYEKGYQSTDTAVSSVFSKMKGVGYTNVNGTERIWDVADYVFPSQVGDWSALKACWNIKCVHHMTPNWLAICFPSGASHWPLLTGLW